MFLKFHCVMNKSYGNYTKKVIFGSSWMDLFTHPASEGWDC